MSIQANARKLLDTVIRAKSLHALRWDLRGSLDKCHWHTEAAGAVHTRPGHRQRALHFCNHHGRRLRQRVDQLLDNGMGLHRLPNGSASLAVADVMAFVLCRGS